MERSPPYLSDREKKTCLPLLALLPCVLCVLCVKRGVPSSSFCWAADDPAAARAVDSINSRPVMCGKKLGWGWGGSRPAI